MNNYQQTIINQYTYYAGDSVSPAKSVAINSLIESFNDAIDPQADIEQFLSYVWNVETAQGFGLDILGRIVGVNRNIEVAALINYFGFSGYSQSAQNVDTLFSGQVLVDTSAAFACGSHAKFQFTIPDSGSATIQIYGNNNNDDTSGIPIRTINITGPGSVGAFIPDGWPYYYATITSISGTTAGLTLTMSYLTNQATSTGYLPFGFGTWFPGYAAEEVYQLPDNAFRQLVLAKALANITRITAQNLNKLLQMLFPGERAYVVDAGNMAMFYVFDFILQSWQYAIITQSNVLPHCSGVATYFLQGPVSQYFGFAGQTFGSGSFMSASDFVKIA